MMITTLFFRRSAAWAKRGARWASLAILPATSAVAQLAWAQPEIRVTPAADQKIVTIEFDFTNRGDKPIHIQSVTSSCGCIATKLKQQTWAPQEAGKIGVEMDLKGLTGKQERIVLVTTDDAPGHPKALALIVDVPETLAIHPRLLRWKVDEPETEKIVTIKIAPERKSRVAGVRSLSPAFDVQWRAAEEPGVFQVRVRPTERGRLVQGTIQITTTGERQDTETFLVYASVK